MNVNSTLQRQGSPILLLTHLYATLPGLPQAEFHVSPVYPTRLEISIHDDLGAFAVWLAALELPTPTEKHYGGSSWLVTEGVVADVPVHLHGYGTRKDVSAFAAGLVSA